MKKILFFLLMALPVVASSQEKIPTPSPEAEALFTKVMAQANPKHVQWIKSTATETNAKKLSDQEVAGKAKSYAALNKLAGDDIEAIAFLILMQASKSAQEDLKAIMSKVKSINKNKEALRQMMTVVQEKKAMSSLQLDSFKLISNRTIALKQNKNPEMVKFVRSTPATKPISKAELDSQVEKAKKDLDSMSEMGEMESLRLQMAMDRMSKMMSTLSNLLKKISDTQNSIVQNLK